LARDIGGKPSFSYIENMPAFVLLSCLMTVFFCSALMVITFYMRSVMAFKQAENPDVKNNR
jgi:hypothetical protein